MTLSPDLPRSAPLCPQCATPTGPLTVDGEDIWRCPDPECGRRTYGTGSEDDDNCLPPYTETDADGAVLVYHGNGELDLEATGELASQGGPDEDDGEGSAATIVPPLDLAPGTLLVAVGPGGSGKSTWAETAPVDVVICLDVLRGEIGEDEGDQSVTPAAVARQNALLEQHLSAGATVFLDSTNVEPHVRADLVKRARQHGRPIAALWFPTSFDTCWRRNWSRPTNRRVPKDTLRWQHALAAKATASVLLAEGFTAVYEYDDPWENPMWHDVGPFDAEGWKLHPDGSRIHRWTCPIHDGEDCDGQCGPERFGYPRNWTPPQEIDTDTCDRVTTGRVDREDT